MAEPEGWPERLPPLVSKATTPAELAVELSHGIKRVRQAAGWNGLPPRTRRPMTSSTARLSALSGRQYLSHVVARGELGGSTISGVPRRAQA